MSIDKSCLEHINEVQLWLKMEEIDGKYRGNARSIELLDLREYDSVMSELRRRGVTKLDYHQRNYTMLCKAKSLERL